ncbi:HNH endonuclease [Pseudomonas aeruginosa]|uniref:HNH endonuclease n=1 Tax=Pseudomonas aeruginosa TaxID=287 RepID=UPI00287F9885|nr:HNH endonuclease [Pseudomonas aeruginosa]
MRPILLGVKRDAWREDDLREDDRFRDARAKALSRDGSRCQFCGWVDDKWLEAHHVDDDHDNNDPQNLVTACAWCHRAHHIGLAGVFQLGFIALHPIPGQVLPSQPMINQMVRFYDWAAYSGRSQSPYVKRWVATCQEFFELAVKSAEHVLGTANPSELGDVLLNLDQESYEARGTWLDGFRLVPILFDELDQSAEQHRLELERRKHWMNRIKTIVGPPR